jgi:hypothetical protein
MNNLLLETILKILKENYNIEIFSMNENIKKIYLFQYFHKESIKFENGIYPFTKEEFILIYYDQYNDKKLIQTIISTYKYINL